MRKPDEADQIKIDAQRQRSLAIDIDTMRPKKGSGIDTVTISSGKDSVTLKAAK